MRGPIAARCGVRDDRIAGCRKLSDMRNLAHFHAVSCALRFFGEAQGLHVRLALVTLAEIPRKCPFKKS
jgi:hypothetical protein